MKNQKSYMPFKLDEDLKKVHDDESGEFFSANPTTKSGRDTMMKIAKENRWLYDPEKIINDTTDDKYHDYIVFARTFRQQFRYILSFAEGNHRLIALIYAMLALVPLPNVKLIDQYQRNNDTVTEGRLNDQYLNIDENEVRNYTFQSSHLSKKKDYLSVIKHLLLDNENPNAFNQKLFVEIMTAKVNASNSVHGNAYALSLNNIATISSDISTLRNNSSHQSNFDLANTMIQSIQQQETVNYEDIECIKIIAGKGKTVDVQFNDFEDFDPNKYLKNYPQLKPFFEDPIRNQSNINHLVRVWLAKDGTDQGKVRGRPAAKFNEITVRQKTGGRGTSAQLHQKLFNLQVMDMFLWYTLIWQNESYFRPQERKQVNGMLCKAYYYARYEKSDNIVPNWNKSKFQELPDAVRKTIDPNWAVDTGTNTKARPGFGSDHAMENAVTMLMYHAIVTSDYINDKNLLKGVFDRVKEDFKTPSEQRVHLGKLPCKCKNRNYESNTTC